MATVTITDADMSIDGRGTRRKLPGALVRWWAGVSGRVAGWCINLAVTRYETKIATLRERLEIAELNHAVEKRKQQAEIDSLKAEATALAELLVRVSAATKLSALASQMQIDSLKHHEE